MQASLLTPPHFHTTFSALLSVFLLLLLGKSPGLFVGSGRGLFQAVWKQELEDSRQHLWFQLHHHICQLWPFAGAQQGNQSSMHIHLHHCLHTPSPLCRSFFTTFSLTRCVSWAFLMFFSSCILLPPAREAFLAALPRMRLLMVKLVADSLRKVSPF